MILGANNAHWRPDLAAALDLDMRITVRMADVYPTRDSYYEDKPDWSTPDGMINAARAEGRRILILLSTVPLWCGGGKYGTRLNWGFRGEWFEFTGEVRRRYGSDPTMSFEIMNEPDHEWNLGILGVGWDGETPLPVEWEGIGPAMGSRPDWRTALRWWEIEGWNPKGGVSFHCNGRGKPLKAMFKWVRRHRAMIQVLAKHAGDWYITEFNLTPVAERGDEILRALAALKAAGCAGVWWYQLVDQGDGDGLYHQLPGGQFVSSEHESLRDAASAEGEFHNRLRARDYGPSRAQDVAALTPTRRDRWYARAAYLWGWLRVATRTERL